MHTTRYTAAAFIGGGEMFAIGLGVYIFNSPLGSEPLPVGLGEFYAVMLIKSSCYPVKRAALSV